MVIKRVGVLRLATFHSAMMAAFGLIVGLVLAGFGTMFGGTATHHSGLLGMAGGLAALIVFPIMYGIIGFIVGAVGGALYNLVTGVVGGIEIEVE